MERSMTMNKDDVRRAELGTVEMVVEIVVDLIRLAGEDGLPSGELYMTLLRNKVVEDKPTYDTLILLLKQRDLIEERFYCLHIKPVKVHT